MSSGVQVDDEVQEVYKKMKVHLSKDDSNEYYKFVMLKIEGGMVIVEKDNVVRVKDLKGEKDIFKSLMARLPDKDCRYALYDCHFETKETPKEDMVFLLWAPDDGPIKQRMIYASSCSDLKKSLQGLKHEWQINDPADIRDTSALVEKLGGKGYVKTLEGKEL